MRVGAITLKTVFLLLLCVFFSFNAFGQAESDEAKQEVAVEAITLARDDGNGKVGEAVTGFLTTDNPIHCSVQLNSTKPTTVKMDFIVVKVNGVKPETKVFTTSYKTNGKQSRVNFTGSPEDNWIAGGYRIDIFVDGKAGGSQSFEIQEPASTTKTPKESTTKESTTKEKAIPQAKPDEKPRPDFKPKLAKRFRKG